MTKLIIARHGNTFGPDDTVTYIGARTDLPLVESGREQACAIGRYLRNQNLIPEVVYCSHLRRTQETARFAIKESGCHNPVYPLDIFNEIDYGPDENKTREEIIARIGEKALRDWDERNVVPPGWIVNSDEIIDNWRRFVTQAVDENQVTLVVTSNGIARFAPYILGDYDQFQRGHPSKLATGALGIFDYGNKWVLSVWNFLP